LRKDSIKHFQPPFIDLLETFVFPLLSDRIYGMITPLQPRSSPHELQIDCRLTFPEKAYC